MGKASTVTRAEQRRARLVMWCLESAYSGMAVYSGTTEPG